MPIAIAESAPSVQEEGAGPLSELANEKTYQRLAEQILSLIASGEFPVGKRLPSERNLADRFQVSRTSVREAVIALEVQEMVEVRGGSGIYVCRPADSVKPVYVPDGPGPFELLRARRLLEGEIAAQAAELRKDIDVDRIYSALAAMRDNCDDKRANEDADRMFHVRIAEATGNAVLVSMVTALWDQLRGPIWARLEEHFHTPDLREASLQDHQKVFSALVARDAAGARNAMHAHIDRVVGEFVKGWA
ncbi:FadR/GntR family transcriptional regulator [Polaromonas sp.]|uniref:FadR/GntR family transcriptional regulator n=1 Tax=Polaromonas sp. TaxID=1869339 RepID=UPI0039C94CF9